MYTISGCERGEVMKIGLTRSVVIISVLIIFPLSTYSAEPKLGQKTGQSKQVTSNQTRPNNMPGKNGQNRSSGQDQGFNNNFNKNHNNRHDFCDNNDRSHGGHDNWHGHNHHHMGSHKFNPLYAPYYYIGYYGYAPYTNYYAYEDPDYPLGYGTTLGTTLERQSNLEVNRFGEDSAAPADYRQDNSDAGYVDTDSPEGYVADNYNPPPSEGQTIYVWVDESGVRNYVNDLDFVPLRYRDIVTTLDAE